MSDSNVDLSALWFFPQRTRRPRVKFKVMDKWKDRIERADRIAVQKHRGTSSFHLNHHLG